MFHRLASLFKTFTFRLALVYVGIFGLSVIALFAFIYTFAMNYMQTQIDNSIRTRYSYLLDEYHMNGSTGVEARIKEMIATDDDGSGIYMLVNQKSEKLSGNLAEWPTEAVKESNFDADGQWVRFYIVDMQDSSQGIEVRAIIKPLSKWRSILVGQSLLSKMQIERTVVQTFWASMFLSLVMAFFGAIVMTQSVMRRINIINRSAKTIMRGHLSVRIPYTPGGDEFDDLSFNLNHMLDRIETLLQSLSNFANSIAHDLRSPLTRIIGRLDAALRNIDRKNQAYTVLENNIHDLQGLVSTFNSILKISELEANTEFRSFEACDLKRVMENLVEFYGPYAAEKDIALINTIAEPVTIYGEKNLLAQAFANLIDNAIKFTGSSGHITIACLQTDTDVAIIVADDGPGIPAEYREKVFEKFFRLEQSRHTKGNGLGLSLVAAVARIHSATVMLEDNHPGLKVTLSFPRMDA